jgi:TonB-dependent starch-binding outer membrane protein SusC
MVLNPLCPFTAPWILPVRSEVVNKTLLIMKFTAIFLLAACLTASAEGFSQRLTLHEKNVSLQKVFKEIHRQTGYQFFYKDELLKKAGKIDISVTEVSLEQVLEICFKNLAVDYTIKDKTIIVRKKSFTINEGKESIKEELSITVTGRVTNKNNEPLAGASVIIKRTGKGDIAGANGGFKLHNVNIDDVITVTFTGHKELNVKVGDRTTFVLVLEEAQDELDRVIVQAYGKTSRRLSTGNISKVSGAEISLQPVSNILAALEGRVPGLQITQLSGVPGSGYRIQLRGQNSIGTLPANLPANDPLFIIDGVPFAANNSNLSTVPSSLGSAGRSPLNSINPNDIESIEVLKDADATAIYGSRGGNGVILITTKKGKAGKTHVDVNFYTGVGKVLSPMKLLNSDQYIKMRREALINDGVALTNVNAGEVLLWDTTRYTDFQELLIGNTARTTDANVSLSGGSVNTQFLMSSGYHRETTVFPGKLGDSRVSFNLNLNHSSADQKFKLSVSANYSTAKSDLLSSDLTSLTFLAPNAPDLYDSIGNLKWQEKGINFTNPLAYLKQNYNSLTNNLTSNLRLNYTLFPGLAVRCNLGYNTLQTEEKTAMPISSNNPIVSATASLSLAQMNFRSWIVEPQAEYSKKIGQGRLNVLVGSTWQENINNAASQYGTGITSDAFINALSAAPNIAVKTDNNTYRYQAIFGRLTYYFKETYILNMSGRRDGSSRFGPGKQFGNFGAVGAAWIFSSIRGIKESLRFLSFGKIRGSYGTTGNDNIGDYQYLDLWTINSGNSPYMGIPGIQPNRPFDPGFSWEVNKKLEGGLDIGLLNDRMLLSAVWYRNRSSNLLISNPLATQTGFNSIGARNFPGVVQNTGWEFTLNSRNFTGKDFTWTTAATFTIPRNKLVSFPGLAASSYANTLVEGEPLNIAKVYNYTGINPATGLFTVSDLDGNGIYNALDQVPLNLNPEYYGGISNSLNYKAWQLDIFIEGRKQPAYNYLRELYNVNPPGFSQLNMLNNQPVAVLNRWQKSGETAQFQKYTAIFGSAAHNAIKNFTLSNAGVVDGSFIRIKTISLSYHLRNKWIEKVSMNGARIYLTGQNLFTITGYEGTDPETRSAYVLPPLRTIVAGLQFNF